MNFDNRLFFRNILNFDIGLFYRNIHEFLYWIIFRKPFEETQTLYKPTKNTLYLICRPKHNYDISNICFQNEILKKSRENQNKFHIQ